MFHLTGSEMSWTDHSIMAAILAGGNARRLGGMHKGLLATANGMTFIVQIIRQLRAAGLESIIIIANDAVPYSGCGCEIVPDMRAGYGPLGGIEAALTRASGQAAATLLLPCDLPAITDSEIRELIAAYRRLQARVVYARTDAFAHPLCSVVHNGVLGEVTAALDCGERKVTRLWQHLGAVGVPFSNEQAFVNINTASDLRCWQTPEEDCRS